MKIQPGTVSRKMTKLKVMMPRLNILKRQCLTRKRIRRKKAYIKKHNKKQEHGKKTYS